MQYQDYKSLLTHRKLEVNLGNAYLSTKGRAPSLKLGEANFHLLCGGKLKALLHLIFILCKTEIRPRSLREGHEALLVHETVNLLGKRTNIFTAVSWVSFNLCLISKVLWARLTIFTEFPMQRGKI